jgi:hypothetical protein
MPEITHERIAAIRARLDGAHAQPPQSDPSAALLAIDLEDLLDAAAVLCHARAIAERQRHLLKPEESTRWCRDGCPVCADRKWYVQSSGAALWALCDLLLSGQAGRA